MPVRFSIAELSQATGLNRRLIHDYVARELIPRPHGSGKGAHYDEEHYLRLRLISLLKGMGLRLERIEDALAGWSLEEIRQIVEAAEGQDPESLSELHDWLAIGITSAGLLEDARTAPDELPDPQRRWASARQDELFLEEALMSAEATPPETAELSLFAKDEGSLEEEPSGSTPLSETPQRAADLISARRALPSRERWTRLRLTPEVELSYREGMSALVTKKVQQLRAYAEELFGAASEE